MQFVFDPKKPYRVCYGWNFCQTTATEKEALEVAASIEPGRFVHVNIWKGTTSKGKFRWTLAHQIAVGS